MKRFTQHAVSIGPWMLIDLLGFIASYIAAYALRVGSLYSTDFPIEPFLRTVLCISPACLFVLFLTKMYSLMHSKKLYEYLSILFGASIISASLFALGYFFWFGLFFSRLLLLEAIVFSVVTLIVTHSIGNAFVRWMMRKNGFMKILIIGSPKSAKGAIEHLKKSKYPCEFIGIMDSIAKDISVLGVPVLGRMQKLDQIISEKSPTHILIVGALEHTATLLHTCHLHSIELLLPPSVLGMKDQSEIVQGYLDGYPISIIKP